MLPLDDSRRRDRPQTRDELFMNLHLSIKIRQILLFLATSFVLLLASCQTSEVKKDAGLALFPSQSEKEPDGLRLSLRTLIISTGDEENDTGLALIKRLHERLGTPYDILDATEETLTATRLFSGEHGHYNAIILTDAVLWDETAEHKSAFTAEEWYLLHEYERRFGVRESIMAGYPVVDPALGLNYGLNGSRTFTGKFAGNWHAPAGETELYEGINTKNPVPITGYAVGSDVAETGFGPEVVPLLTERETGKILIALLRYPDGREVLFSGINQDPLYLHSQLLAYEFLNFASRGVFIGARQVYLHLHVDDLFSPDALWDPASNTTVPGNTYRMTPHDVENTIRFLDRLRNRFPTAAGLRLDFAFNGLWTGEDDELYRTLIDSDNDFRYIDHTFSHYDMDVSNGTTYEKAREEIERNRTVWKRLGLPEFEENRVVLVSGMHSGLTDRATQTPYPEGKNDAFLRAVQDSGVRYLASDASQPNQNREHFIPGFDILLLPRYPTALFFNVSRPATLQDEYNYMFHESYMEKGLNPETTPGASPKPRNYQEILALDAEQAVKHMLEYSPWAHYFHQTNLRDYEGGKTLLSDWLEETLTRYERLATLPILSLPYYEVGRRTEERIAARKAGVEGIWYLQDDRVTLIADRKANIFVTGLKGGRLYGGQRIRKLSVGPRSKSFAIDRALDE